MRWPSANRRRRLFVLCHVVWPGLACPSGWIIWQAIHAVRGAMPLALLGHRRGRRKEGVEKEASTKTTTATITKYFNFLLLPEVC